MLILEEKKYSWNDDSAEKDGHNVFKLKARWGTLTTWLSVKFQMMLFFSEGWPLVRRLGGGSSPWRS